MYKIVFSATGRTEKSADAFCRAFDKVEKIDLTVNNFNDMELSTSDFCLLAVPVYGGRVPAPATENILKIKANGAKAVLMVVYGNRAYDDALAELKDTAEKAGFLCIGACATVAQHSMMPRVAEQRPDENDKRQLKEFAVRAKEKALCNIDASHISVPGNIPKKPLGKMPVHPKASASCLKCGVCAEGCPVGAIPSDNLLMTDKTKCITCMRCVEICPNDSRVFMPGIMSAAGLVMKKVWGKYLENEFYI